ncbi:MAG: hypothetical protein JWP89_5057 [Schlesneria sp.]|nr:hypothetical protein [Schlesneria sp.]
MTFDQQRGSELREDAGRFQAIWASDVNARRRQNRQIRKNRRQAAEMRILSSPRLNCQDRIFFVSPLNNHAYSGTDFSFAEEQDS